MPSSAAREAITTMMDEKLGALRIPSPVPKLSRTPGRVRWLGKTMGADNEYVFRELLDLDAAALQRLEQQGVI